MIKSHPLLSCAGIAALGAFINCSSKFDRGTFEFNSPSIDSLFDAFILGTLPVIVVTAIDQFGHQNLFNNKPLEYGLTVFEASRGFEALCQSMPPQRSSSVKKLTINTAVQAVIFKAILDGANSAIESDNLDGANSDPLNDHATEEVSPYQN